MSMQQDTQRLYNKYRPRTLDDMVGQEDTVAIMRGLIKNKAFTSSREYIFESQVGGVGKSTIARIFSRAINCLNTQNGEPCDKCKNCEAFNNGSYADYVEINGAEFKGVQEIKPIVNLASQYPMNADGWRVIVIDEFQRVSKQAQSEFLDLIEFKSNRTIFIFTTTEMEQILQPIQTRCSNLTFGRVPTGKIIDRLIHVSKNENISYDKKSLGQIASMSDGSLREAVKLLDLYRLSYGEVKNINITSKYSKIMEYLFNGVKGTTAYIEEDIYSLKTNNLYKDLGAVILEIKQCSPKKVSEEVFDRYYPVLENEIDNIIKNFLSYKPNDSESFLLFLSLLQSDFIKLGKIQKRSTREIIVKQKEDKPKINIGEVFKNFGFYRKQ